MRRREVCEDTRVSNAQAQDIVEVEWQFEAQDVERAAAWLAGAAVPGYRVRAGKTKEQRDTYFDTADWRLHRAGFTCRVRDKGDGLEVTLKGMAAAQDGIRSRREITEQVAPGTSPAGAPGPCGAIIRLIAGRHDARALFEIAQRRRTFVLEDEGGELAEISVDDGQVRGIDGRGARIARVEVEVTDGAVERARRFVDVLVVAGGLRPADTSKFQAALAATGLAGQQAPELGPTAVSAEMTAGEVAYAVMRRQFGVFLANEGGTRLGEDIEALHDMRVAARRLRAAMVAFRPFLPPRMESMRMQLGWVAAALGTVRDLDVQIERMAEWRAGFSAEQAQVLDGIERLLQARRERARARMLAVLDSRRYDGIVERFAAWLRIGLPRTFAPGRVPVLAVAPDLVERRYRRVRKMGDAINRGSVPDAYHALRIEAKKLRYALEFVGPIYGKPAIDLSARVAAMQDVLGLHQDAEIAIPMLREMATVAGRRLGPETVLAMGMIAERYRVHAAELRAQFPDVYAGIRSGRWMALRKAMEARRPV